MTVIINIRRARARKPEGSHGHRPSWQLLGLQLSVRPVAGHTEMWRRLQGKSWIGAGAAAGCCHDSSNLLLPPPLSTFLPCPVSLLCCLQVQEQGQASSDKGLSSCRPWRHLSLALTFCRGVERHSQGYPAALAVYEEGPSLLPLRSLRGKFSLCTPAGQQHPHIDSFCTSRSSTEMKKTSQPCFAL